MKKYRAEYERWLNSSVLTADEREELLSISDNEELLEYRFSEPMNFGTAGLRSTMYMGISCMNRFTVIQTTRGLAELVKKNGAESRGVAIGYDSRNNSELFARTAASVLAGAGIRVFIFDDIRPTPELSFAVRETGAIAGINVTASHNPKEYNGYKAYWEDGAQLSPENAKLVKEASERYDVLDVSGIMDFDNGVSSGIITVLDKTFDDIYLDRVLETSVNKDAIASLGDELKVVYTPLHGAGRVLVPEVFSKAGLKKLYTVDSQMTKDGNFPTVKKPNPEYREVFTDGIKIADKEGADLIIATDPDSDRVGVMARNKDGEFETVTGNQMGALLLDYVITERRRQGRLPAHAFAVKSIVSTDMAYKIADVNGIKLHDVLTGFKYIGETVKQYEERGLEDGFLLGFEESYGYLLGTYARDKDAVETSLIILEMAAYYYKRGMTLISALDELFKRYGYYREAVSDVYMEGLSGIAKRREVMARLKDNPPTEIAGIRITKIADYSTGIIKEINTGKEESTGQPPSEVFAYTLDGGDKVIIRPSGTEPKIKIYVLAHAETKEKAYAKADILLSSATKLTEI